MSKLQLPNVTLFLCDCLNVDLSIKVIEHCKRLCDFGEVKFLTSLETDYEHAVKIPPLNSLVAYSIFMLTKSHEYIDTDKMLVVQRDGFILNPQSWQDAFNAFDMIGPIFMQYDKGSSGGFSLRSKKIMQHAASILPEWDWTQSGADKIQKRVGVYEDGFLSFAQEFKHFNFPTLDQCADFASGGNRNPKYFRSQPFGFHRTFERICFQTGFVDSSDPTRDIAASYDHEIESLL